jgi:hypothetical protein
MDFHDRFKTFLDKEGVKISTFEAKMGFSNGSLSKAIEQKRAIGSDRLETIFAKYPDLNPSWLMNGQGEMYFKRISGDEIGKLDEKKSIEVQHQLLKELKDLKDRLMSNSEKKDEIIFKLMAKVEALEEELNQYKKGVIG